MSHNPCRIKYVLVHGRRDEFAGNVTRTSLIRGLENEDFHILTYDSLAEALHSKSQLYMAVKKYDHIEILTNTFISDALFALLPPSYISITDELRKSILDNKKSWQYLSLQGGYVLEDALPQIGVVRV